MTEIRFYHLQKKSLEQALPEILNKIYSLGKKVIVKLSDKKYLNTIDKLLWTYDGGSFLPHATDKNKDLANRQPILLTTGDENLNSAEVLILLNGTTHEDMSNYDICCEIFDGNDSNSLTIAREHWKKHKEQEKFDLVYFQQSNSGAWQEKLKIKV